MATGQVIRHDGAGGGRHGRRERHRRGGQFRKHGERAVDGLQNGDPESREQRREHREGEHPDDDDSPNGMTRGRALHAQDEDRGGGDRGTERATGG